MKKWYTKALCFLMTVVLVLSMSVTALATESNGTTDQTPAMWDNASDQNYKVWSNVVQSYLEPTADGGYLRIQGGSYVLVEKYDKDFAFVSSFSIATELPLFGGYYNDGTYRYIVTGQQNKEENNSKEVLRVVKYDKSWKRLSSASLYGSNTTIPFNAGSLRMTHSGNVLYIRTSHEMYAKNGVNHQASMMLTISTANMKITTAQIKPASLASGYISHSFNQFVQVDGKDLLAVDHGDAYPRSIVLMRNSGAAGNTATPSKVKTVDVLELYGSIGANATGASVGGFEISGNAYLIAGNSAVQNEKINAFSQRNIFVSATAKTNFTKAGTKITWLTNYPNNSGYIVSTPHLVKVNTNRFAVLWTETNDNNPKEPTQLKLAYVDKNGKWDGKIYSAEGELSDCKPIVVNGRIIWYTAYGADYNTSWAPEFYEINQTEPEKIKVHHRLKQGLTVEPTAQSTGVWSISCQNGCHYQMQITLPAISDADYDCIMIKMPTCTDSGQAVYIWKGTTYGTIGWESQLDPLNHDWQAATCTTAKTCKICGATSGNAKGHDWKAATCTKPKTCKTCGATTGSASHTYSHSYDYKCDVCNATRTVDMTRPMMNMYRMYDPNSGEHFYTGSEVERDNLVAVGWKYEGVGFTFPLTTGDPVHRLYDPYSGEHLYTMDVAEMNKLLAKGWNY